ncbi:glycosyltransferase family 9 protein [Candidatus Methylomirabilis sp.]
MRLLMKPEPEVRGSEAATRPLLIFITYTGIGDLLMALPLFDALRSQFKALPVIPSAYAELAELLHHDRLLDGYLLVDEGLVFLRQPLRHLLMCRAVSDLQADVVAIYGKLVMAYGTRLGLLRAGRVLYCHPRGMGPRSTSTFEHLPTTGNQMRDYLQFASRLGLSGNGARATFTEGLKAGLAQEAQALIPWPSYVTVAPWTSDPRRDASLRFFRECIDIIVHEGGLPVVLTGVAQYRKIAEDLLRGLPDTQAMSLVGSTTIRQMLGLLAGTRFLLTNDGGSLHMARLVGTPAIAAFGPTAPELRLHTFAEELMAIRQPLPCSPCEHTPARYKCPGPYLDCLRSLEAASARQALLLACRAVTERTV